MVPATCWLKTNKKEGNHFPKRTWGFSSSCQGPHISIIFLGPLQFLGHVQFQGARSSLLLLWQSQHQWCDFLESRSWRRKPSSWGWMHLASVYHPHHQQTLSQQLGNHPALGENAASWVETEQIHPSQAKLSKAQLSLHWNSDSAWKILADLQLGLALVNVTTISQITHSLNKTQFDLKLWDINLKGEKRQERSQRRASYYISAIIEYICIHAFLTE